MQHGIFTMSALDLARALEKAKCAGAEVTARRIQARLAELSPPLFATVSHEVGRGRMATAGLAA